MRNVVLVALVAWIATASWAQQSKEAKPETLLRWSFVGTKHLAANKDLQVFNQVRSMPEAAALRDAAAQTIARRAAARFTGGNTNSRGEIVALIQPLIPDLVQNESRFQMDTQGAQDADWILAVKLADKRSQDWGKALAQLAKLAGMQGASANAAKWTATRDKYNFSFSRAKDWTVIQGGYGAASSQTSKDFHAALGKRNGRFALDAAVNAPLLAKLWSAPQLTPYPSLTLRAEPKRDGFQSEMILDYPQDLGIKPEKWNVPAELIREPLIGFTAIQGVQKKLGALEKFRALGTKETPNQVFIWAQSLSPFSITLAADVENPAEAVTNAARAFMEIKLPSGDLMLPTNRVALVWRGLPTIVPFLEVAPAPNASFLTAGLFPVDEMAAEPAPAELFAALNQKNLVYYDWEITGERLEQWIPLWQLYYLIQNQLGPDNSSPSAKLLKELQFKIGNTITAGTLENERRIKFIRQSHLGTTALELVLLAHLLDAQDLVPMKRSDKDSKPGAPAAGLP